MKSYYCFIRDLGNMQVGSFVYHVAVGTSDRDQTKLALVREYAKDCGFYFHIRSEQTRIALENARRRFVNGYESWREPFNHAKVSISELYKMIIDDSFSFYESSYVSTPAQIRYSHQLDPLFIQSQNNLQCITKCLTSRRKNLSQRLKADTSLVACYFCFILILFAIHGCIRTMCLNWFGAI